MRGFVPAFAEIGLPRLIADIANSAGIFFEKAEGDKELKEPGCRALYLRLYNLGHGMIDEDLTAVLFGKLYKIAKTVSCSDRIKDITAEQGSAAVELKVEIAPARFRSEKELDAAVLVHRGHITSMPAENVLVFNPEYAGDAGLIMEQAH